MRMRAKLLFTIFLTSAIASSAGAQRKAAEPKIDASPAALEKRIDTYDFDGADELLQRYSAAKNADETIAEHLRDRIIMGRNMLERVEKIQVIDSITVDKEAILKTFNLSPSAGKILNNSALPEGFPRNSATTVYLPERADRMLWGAPDADGRTRIVESSLLADGTHETPTPLDENVNNPSAHDVSYPFVMSDGVTLYFASNNPATSLGGYDIFITRYDGEKYLEPQNIGMPYNSPGNDYLFAIDESLGIGWWATDRNAPEGKVTVYVFLPEEMRSNYPADTPGLISLALLQSIAATHKPGVDYSKIIEKAHTKRHSDTAAIGPDFRFSLPDGRIITSIDQLPTENARYALEDYLDKIDLLNELINDLDELRLQIKNGTSTPDIENAILRGEAREQQMRNELLRLSNRVVSIATENDDR